MSVATNRQMMPNLTQEAPAPIKARYDAAQNSPQHRNYWAAADSLDANAANSRAVRERLVPRARYEVGNNGYSDGMVQTHVNYLMGDTGPRLNMLTNSQGFNNIVELEWQRWAKAALLRRKLWCMGHAKVQDGEPFGIMRTNPRLNHAVKLDIKLIETEQCQSPYLPYRTEGRVDGIIFDEFDNPILFEVLPHHPGSDSANGINAFTQPDLIPAEFMLHWFQLRRPGQQRGIPEFTSTLNVGAGSRRFREATIAAAETAADHGLVLKTTFAPDTVDQVRPLSEFEIDKNMMTAMPQGWDPVQIKAEHPTTTYDAFNKSQVGESARPKSIPYNVAAADSSRHNFASGKLDHQPWFVGIGVERTDCEDMILDKLFQQWFWEARAAFGWVWTQEQLPRHTWKWPELPVADEKARATANQTRLSSGQATLSDVHPDFDAFLQRFMVDYGYETEDEAKEALRQLNLQTVTTSVNVQPNSEQVGQAVEQEQEEAAEELQEDFQNA